MARARRKLRCLEYEDAQYILVGVLNASPQERMLPEIFTSLAETEYHRHHFRNSMHYAKLAIEILQVNPSQMAVLERENLLQKMHNYLELGVEGMKKARQEFAANPGTGAAANS